MPFPDSYSSNHSFWLKKETLSISARFACVKSHSFIFSLNSYCPFVMRFSSCYLCSSAIFSKLLLILIWEYEEGKATETAVDIVSDVSENSHGNVCSEVLSKVVACQHGI